MTDKTRKEEQEIAFEKLYQEIRDLPDFLMAAEMFDNLPDTFVASEDDIPF